MKVIKPQITKLSPVGILENRKPHSVFVRRHNLVTNLEAVKSETENITDLDSRQWLFLVEGYRKYHSMENVFLDDFVEDLNIKTRDPIQAPFTDKIAEAASVEKIVAALSILTIDYLDLIAENNIEQLEKEVLDEMFNQSLDVIARTFSVSTKTLKKSFSKLRWHNEEKLANQLLFLSRKRKELINESNIQSKIKLAEILNENKHPNLFILSGIEHESIFTE